MGLFQPGPAQAKANGSLFLVLAKARSEAELEQPDLPDTQCRGGTGETGSGGKEGRVGFDPSGWDGLELGQREADLFHPGGQLDSVGEDGTVSCLEGELYGLGCVGSRASFYA